MKKAVLSLAGEWMLCWQDTAKGTIRSNDGLWDSAVGCKVPGDVHIALAEAGVIEDPLLDVNSMKCRWMEEKEFWYKKVFSVEDDFLQDVTELVLEGLDLTADIWLNDQYIGSHNNAFTKKVIDVSESIKIGENILVVRIDDGVHGVKDKPLDLMEYSWNNEQPYRAWMRKPQFVYGWDWTIWMPSCGIWKDVVLNSYSKAVIRDINVVTKYEGEEISKAEQVRLAVAIDMEAFQAGNYMLNCEVYGDERYGNVAEAKVTKRMELQAKEQGNVTCTMELVLDNQELWWPNGAGKPYLYKVNLSLADEEGNVLQSECKKHGLRSVRIQEDALEGRARTFTFVINDQRIFAKGANHVPADCFPGRITDEKNRKLLTAAAEANMNMIRVWGGGIYESDGFMDACDELGIMVWHDFMFACAYYPDYDPEFYEEVRKEATEAIKRLRSHASLIGWSGNNEIQEMYLSAQNNGKIFPWYGGRFYEELLPTLVNELCPDRIYRQSSPSGGDEPASYDRGDQHTWHFTHRSDWEHYLDLWRFTDFDFKFLSEFGIIGAMNLESAKKCISEQALYRDSEEWLHHTNTNTDHQLLNIFVKKYFDMDEDISLQDFILKSQVIQAEIMRHVYDELRSRKFRCSGVLLWTLSDSYGINNWSVIDYYLGKRPIYYYLRRSMAPVNLALKGYEVQNFDGMANYKEYYKGTVEPVEISVANDTLEEKQVVLEYKVQTFDGQILKSEEMSLLIPSNGVVKGADVDISDIKDTFVPEETYLYAQVRDGEQVLNENRYFFAPYRNLALRPAVVKGTIRKISKEKSELTLSADSFVWMLHLATPDGVEFSDNDFDLLADKKRVITIKGDNLDGYVPELFSLNPGMKAEVIRI